MKQINEVQKTDKLWDHTITKTKKYLNRDLRDASWGEGCELLYLDAFGI